MTGYRIIVPKPVQRQLDMLPDVVRGRVLKRILSLKNGFSRRAAGAQRNEETGVSSLRSWRLGERRSVRGVFLLQVLHDLHGGKKQTG